MHAAAMADALEALSSMERGQPYSVRKADPKRRLAAEIARISQELGVEPVVIGGLAVSHHGYMRLTADVNILVARSDAAALVRRLKTEPGWKRYAEGFKNMLLDVSVDICVEGERTSPHSTETLPNPGDLHLIEVDPLPVPTLPELIALKVMSGRTRDDADVVELLKRHKRRIVSVQRRAAERLSTPEARERLESLVARTTDELARRRR